MIVLYIHRPCRHFRVPGPTPQPNSTMVISTIRGKQAALRDYGLPKTVKKRILPSQIKPSKLSRFQGSHPRFGPDPEPWGFFVSTYLKLALQWTSRKTWEHFQQSDLVGCLVKCSCRGVLRDWLSGIGATGDSCNGTDYCMKDVPKFDVLSCGARISSV